MRFRIFLLKRLLFPRLVGKEPSFRILTDAASLAGHPVLAPAHDPKDKRANNDIIAVKTGINEIPLNLIILFFPGYSTFVSI